MMQLTTKETNAVASYRSNGALAAVATHWPEYLMEAACLGLFMLSASVFGVLLEHPQSALNQLVESVFVRRALGGAAMGITAFFIISSPWGQRSGAHMNPAVTGAFLLLGKIRPWDAAFYMTAQFAGGVVGMLIAAFAIGPPLGNSAVNYVVTLPGPLGLVAAFSGELFISLVMMATVLMFANTAKLSRWTPAVAGLLVASFITFEGPLSGMSINPARTFASAYLAHEWTGWWIYFLAPPIGMLLGAGAHLLIRGGDSVFCAKLHHHNNMRCIFRCNYGALHADK